jgi:hypothetical protein
MSDPALPDTTTHRHTRAPIAELLHSSRRSGPPPEASHAHQRAPITDWLRGWRKPPKVAPYHDHPASRAAVREWWGQVREERRLKRFVEGAKPHPHSRAPVLEHLRGANRPRGPRRGSHPASRAALTDRLRRSA